MSAVSKNAGDGEVTIPVFRVRWSLGSVTSSMEAVDLAFLLARMISNLCKRASNFAATRTGAQVGCCDTCKPLTSIIPIISTSAGYPASKPPTGVPRCIFELFQDYVSLIFFIFAIFFLLLLLVRQLIITGNTKTSWSTTSVLQQASPRAWHTSLLRPPLTA